VIECFKPSFLGVEKLDLDILPLVPVEGQELAEPLPVVAVLSFT
jgi:hypothetical protein